MPNWLEVLSSESVLVLAGVILCIVVGLVIAIAVIMHMNYELYTPWAKLKKAPSTDQQNQVDGSNQ